MQTQYFERNALMRSLKSTRNFAIKRWDGSKRHSPNDRGPHGFGIKIPSRFFFADFHGLPFHYLPMEILQNRKG
jgi:hypothetical protein